MKLTTDVCVLRGGFRIAAETSDLGRKAVALILRAEYMTFRDRKTAH